MVKDMLKMSCITEKSVYLHLISQSCKWPERMTPDGGGT